MIKKERPCAAGWRWPAQGHFHAFREPYLASEYTLSSLCVEWRKKCWYQPLFCPLNAWLQVIIVKPDSFFSAAFFFGTGWTVFRTVWLWINRCVADDTSFSGTEFQDTGFQFRCCRKYRITEPFAEQRIGVPLDTSADDSMIQRKALTVIVVATPFFNQLPGIQ